MFYPIVIIIIINMFSFDVREKSVRGRTLQWRIEWKTTYRRAQRGGARLFTKNPTSQGSMVGNIEAGLQKQATSSHFVVFSVDVHSGYLSSSPIHLSISRRNSLEISPHNNISVEKGTMELSSDR